MAEEIANVNEKQLFHGTKCEAIETICRNGLDWRMCGENGVAFGQGKQWPCEQKLMTCMYLLIHSKIPECQNVEFCYMKNRKHYHLRRK